MPLLWGELNSENSAYNAVNTVVLKKRDIRIICPFCKSDVLLDVSIEDFKETQCKKCHKRITSKNAIFDE